MALQEIGLKAIIDMAQFNRAYNDYINKLGHMNNVTGSSARSLSGQFLGLGNSLLKIGAILSGAVLAGITAVTIAFGKMAMDGLQDAMDLEQGIADIAAVLNITGEDAAFLQDVILKLGIDPTLRVSTFEAAEAIQLLAQAGVFAGQNIQQMEQTAYDAGKAVVMLANATGAQFDQAAAIATDAMTLFNVEAEDMVDVVSDITSVTTATKFTINDYELALRNGGAAAAVMGITLEDFNRVVAASAEELGNGRRAGTGFMNFLNRVTPNTEKAKDLMADLGFIVNGNNQFFDQQTGELKDLREISQLLNDTLFGQVAVVHEVGGRTAEQTAALESMVTEYRKAEQTIFDYTQGADSLLASEEDKNEALAEAQEIMAKLGPSINELNGITGEYNVTLETLGLEQRSAALETIFGNDGMKTAIALANEGAPAILTVAEVMSIFGVNMAEANAMMDEGITNWDVLNATMNETDAMDNAETRTDTLKAKWDNLKDSLIAIRIEAFDPLRQVLEDFIDETIVPFIQNSGGLIDSLKDGGQAFADMVQAIIDGESPFQAFLAFLTDIGELQTAVKLEGLRQSILDIVVPIIDFVQNHSEGFIGAFKAIGTLSAAATIAAIASAIISLMTGIGGLIAIVGVLGFAWSENWGNIQGITKTAVDTISGYLDDIGITQLVEELKTGFSEGGIQGVIAALPDAFSNLGQNVLSIIQGIDWVQVAMTIREGLFSSMENLGEMAGEALNWFINLVNNVDWNTVGKTVFDLVVGYIALNFIVTETILEAVFNFFKGLFTTIDWNAVLEALVTAVPNLIKGIFDAQTKFIETTIIPFVTEIFGSLQERVSEQVDSTSESLTEIGTKIVEHILTGLDTFTTSVLETLATWWFAFYGWFTETMTWETLGYVVTTALLEVFVGFPAKIGETLITWWTAFYVWFTETDWKTLGETVKTKIKDSLVQFGKLVIEVLKGWYQAMFGWFTDTDWTELSEIVKAKIKASLVAFGKVVITVLEGWYDGIFGWFTETDWDSLGTTVVDGVIAGLNAKAQELYEMVGGIAAGAKAAWDAFWDSKSPSRVMIAAGKYLIDGALIGIQDGERELIVGFVEIFGNIWAVVDENMTGITDVAVDGAVEMIAALKQTFSGLEDLFAFGSGLSSIAGNFANLFKETIVDPAAEAAKTAHEEIISELSTGQDTALAALLESTGLSELSDEQIRGISMGEIFLDSGGFQIDPTEEMIRQAQELLAIQRELTLEKSRTFEEDARLVALQEQQANFAFLQQQMDLLEFLEEHEINASDILGGLELGLNADIEALVQAMTTAMAAVVEAAEEELQIASPSARFATIGSQMLAGLAEGFDLTSMLQNVRGSLGNFASSVSSSLPNIRMAGTGVNQTSTQNNYNVNNNFTGSPQVTDANTLAMTLAGFG